MEQLCVCIPVFPSLELEVRWAGPAFENQQGNNFLVKMKRVCSFRGQKNGLTAIINGHHVPKKEFSSSKIDMASKR